MTSKALRMQQLTAVRQLKEDRAAIALARGNALKEQAQTVAAAAKAQHADMQASLVPRLTEHLRAASVLQGSSNRYTDYVIAATADRRKLAQLWNIAETTQAQSVLAARAAEAFRKLHAAALRQRESMEEITASLTAADRKSALLAEEDRLSEQQSGQTTKASLG